MKIMKDSYQICTRCVMDTSDPEIFFDRDGHCNHCTNYFENTIKKLFKGNSGVEEFKKIANKIRQQQKKNKYNCLIGVSGGVDSSYVLHLAKKYDLKPLAIHMDNGWNSEIAIKNIKNICSKLEVDYQSYVLDWQEFKDIQLSVLKSGIVEVELPTDVAIPGALNRIAAKHNIKYIISGGNIVTEGILPEKWFYNAKDKRLLKSIQSKFGKRKIKKFPTYGIVEEIYYKVIKKIKNVYILNYFPFDKNEAMGILKSTYGWKYYGGKHYESKFTGFVQSYIQPVKFNVDYRRATCSTEICAGSMSRDEAINILKNKPYDIKIINEEKKYIVKKLGISMEMFNEILEEKPKSYKDYPNNEIITNFVYSMYRKFYPQGRL